MLRLALMQHLALMPQCLSEKENGNPPSKRLDLQYLLLLRALCREARPISDMHLQGM
jgi:hypothetical protein